MQLTFNNDTRSQMVTVATSNDLVIENNETFTLSLSETDDAVIMLMPPSSTVTITDNTSKYSPSHSIVCSSNEESQLLFLLFSSDIWV